LFKPKPKKRKEKEPFKRVKPKLGNYSMLYSVAHSILISFEFVLFTITV